MILCSLEFEKHKCVRPLAECMPVAGAQNKTKIFLSVFTVLQFITILVFSTEVIGLVFKNTSDQLI